MTNQDKFEILKALITTFQFETLIETEMNVKNQQVLLENIACLFDEEKDKDHKLKNTAYAPKNPDESQMEHDDEQFKKGYKMGFEQAIADCKNQGDVRKNAGYCDTYIKKLQIEFYEKGIKDTVEDCEKTREQIFKSGYNDGFEQGAANLAKECDASHDYGYLKGVKETKKTFVERIKALEDLLMP